MMSKPKEQPRDNITVIDTRNHDDTDIKVDKNELQAQSNVYSWIRPSRGTHIGPISRLLIIYSDLIDCFTASYLIGFCLIILLPQVHRSFKPLDHDHHHPVTPNTTENHSESSSNVTQDSEQDAHHSHHHDLPVGEILVCLGFFIFYSIQLIKVDRINGAGYQAFVSDLKRRLVIGTRYIIPSAFPNVTIRSDNDVPSSDRYTKLDHDEEVLIGGNQEQGTADTTNHKEIIELPGETTQIDGNNDEIDSCTIAEHHHDCCYELIHQIGDYSSYQQQQQRKKSTHQQNTQAQMNKQLGQKIATPEFVSPISSNVPAVSIGSALGSNTDKNGQNYYTYGATNSLYRKSEKFQERDTSLLIQMPPGVMARRRRIDLYTCNQDFLLLFGVLSWISIIDGLIFAAYFNADKQKPPIVDLNDQSTIVNNNLNNNSASILSKDINDEMIEYSDEAQSVLWIQSPDKDEFIKHILYFLLHKILLSIILALEYRYHLNRTNTGNYQDQLKARFDKSLLTSLAKQNKNNSRCHKQQQGQDPNNERSYLLDQRESVPEEGAKKGSEQGTKSDQHFIIVINENSVLCLGFISVVGYLLTTPLGVVIGSIISTQTNLHAVVTFYAVLRAFATGSLLYLAFFVILPKNDSKYLARPLAMVLGFLVLLVVAIFVPYPG